MKECDFSYLVHELPKLTSRCWFEAEIPAHHTSIPSTTGVPGPRTLDEAENSTLPFLTSEVQPVSKKEHKNGNMTKGAFNNLRTWLNKA